jgi:hypothetical protein
MSIHAPRHAFQLNRRNARDASKIAYAGYLREYAHLGDLRKNVDLILQTLLDSRIRDRDTVTDSAIRVVARDLAETLDGADELVRQGAVAPAKLVGRTCLELLAVLRFLFKTCDERISAAMFLQSFNSAEEAGRRYLTNVGLAGDELEEIMAPIRKARINTEYAKQPFLEAKRALESLQVTDPWYSVLDGPNSVGQLMRAVGLGNLHRGYYVPWSSRAHGVCVLDGEQLTGASVSIRPLRSHSTEEFKSVVSLLSMVAIAGVVHLRGQFRPREVKAEFIDSIVSGIDSQDGDLLWASA